MADVVVVIHPHAFEAAFKSRGGIVGRYIEDIARDVEAAAKFEAPGPGKPPRNRTGISYGKGALQASITHNIDALAGDVEATVFPTVKHAKYVHFGTAPHVIRPKNPAGILRFYWWRKMRWAHFKKVNHPGTEANPFMERALKKGCAVHGIV